MLVLVKDGVVLSQHKEGSKVIAGPNTFMPASDGVVFDGYSLHTLKEAPIPPYGKVVVSSVVTFADGEWQQVVALEDVGEEELLLEYRKGLETLSKVEFRAKLRAVRTEKVPEGIYSEDVYTMINLIADRDLREEALDFFDHGQYAERVNPWVDILGAMFGLSPAEIDVAWVQ